MENERLILEALYRLIQDKYMETDDFDVELLELRNNVKIALDKL